MEMEHRVTVIISVMRHPTGLLWQFPNMQIKGPAWALIPGCRRGQCLLYTKPARCKARKQAQAKRKRTGKEKRKADVQVPC